MVTHAPFSIQNYSEQPEHQVFSPSFIESPNSFRKGEEDPIVVSLPGCSIDLMVSELFF